MIRQIHRPSFPLSEFVENFVYYHGLDIPHRMDRFLPDGNTELIIDLTENPQYIYDNETLREIQSCRYAWVSGVRTRPITIPSGRGSRMLIVAFKRGKAFPFYSCPLYELTDIVVEADAAFGRKFNDFREQLLATASVDRMFQLVEIFLLQRIGHNLAQETPMRCIEYALSSIIREPCLRRIQRLGEEIGYSQKHFIDLFKQQVGVTPKGYLRIMRFQKAICAIESNTTISWKRFALESGYYDQAHFIHDFKLFSGFTPADYTNRKTAQLNYVPVA